ncbi:Synaptic vesicle membrane protein VAT-1 -like [Nymphon striatum]|nr:Synaptic vesicle membrane protein VAT-1 -like [Nymphon striatum]
MAEEQNPQTEDGSATTEAKPAEETTPESTNNESPPPKQVRAVVLTGFGGLKSVKVQKKPEPTAGDGEVLIRVKACGLSFLDLMVRQGVIEGPHKTPFIMGFECAGVVEAVGEGVTDLKIDDHVVALAENKAWSELSAVPAKFVYKLPPGMSFQDAAALTMNFTVAYILIHDVGNVREGSSLLVHSAGGGVGQAVTQLCKLIPDVTIFGTASSFKHESIKDTLTHVFDQNVDYVQEIKKINPSGVDLVLDCLCGEHVNRGYTLLKPMGKYVLFGSANTVSGETKSFFSVAKSWWQVDKVNPIKLFDENKTIAGFHLRHLMTVQGFHDYVRTVVEKVFKLWQDDKIKPVIDSTWAFEDVPEAMQKMHDRKNVGKITLDPAMEPKPKPTPTKGKDKETKNNDAKPENQLSTADSTDTETKTEEEPTPDATGTYVHIPILPINIIYELAPVMLSQKRGYVSDMGWTGPDSNLIRSLHSFTSHLMHFMCFHAQELASLFNKEWSRGHGEVVTNVIFQPGSLGVGQTQTTSEMVEPN